MTGCHHCGSTQIEIDPSQGNAFCTECGYVVEENTIVSEVTFTETTGGQSMLAGQFVSSATGTKPMSGGMGYHPHGMGSGGFGLGYTRESREVTLANGRRKMQDIAAALKLTTYHVDAAQRLFQLAMQHNFIQGRKTQNVAAACLYIVCRREKTPHMLIDFSDVLETNVYTLGNTFLKFCRLLNLSLPIIDPSLYIHRFASKLEFEDKTHAVATSALRLVARMRRDWIQTGRRPSGICGASLLIAGRLHGFRRTQKEIIHVVKICDVTLRKRLNEFQMTPSGQLTPQEFDVIDLEEECDPPSFMNMRKKHRVNLFALPTRLHPHDKEKYFQDTKHPLAYHESEQQQQHSNNCHDQDYDDDKDVDYDGEGDGEEEEEASPDSNVFTDDIEKEMAQTLQSAEFQELEKHAAEVVRQPIHAPLRMLQTHLVDALPKIQLQKLQEVFSMPSIKRQEDDQTVEREEIETKGTFEYQDTLAHLSDLDDEEMNDILLAKDEIQLKTELWTELNRDYLEEQEAKAQQIESDRQAGILPKEPKRRKKRKESKRNEPAESAAEATMQMLSTKRISKKINYSVLEGLFDIDVHQFTQIPFLPTSPALPT